MAAHKEDTCTVVTRIAQPILESMGLELVDIEFGRVGPDAVLRLFIDKEGGVLLDDCAGLSRELSMILDVEDVIACNYTLEVSSPGLDRPLKKQSDYDRFAGRMYRAAWRILGRREDAEDVVQDVFLAVVRSRERLNDVRDLRAQALQRHDGSACKLLSTSRV